MPLIAALAACTIIAVTDGDTLKAQCDSQELTPIIIRLDQIDAPERGQAFGRVATKRLAWLCLNQPAVITVIGKDRYNRTLARVQCKGRDAGQDMLKAGMAWVYPTHQTNAQLTEMQAQAQGSRRGLWRDGNPKAPWEYRKSQK